VTGPRPFGSRKRFALMPGSRRSSLRALLVPSPGDEATMVELGPYLTLGSEASTGRAAAADAARRFHRITEHLQVLFKAQGGGARMPAARRRAGVVTPAARRPARGRGGPGNPGRGPVRGAPASRKHSRTAAGGGGAARAGYVCSRGEYAPAPVISSHSLALAEAGFDQAGRPPVRGVGDVALAQGNGRRPCVVQPRPAAGRGRGRPPRAGRLSGSSGISRSKRDLARCRATSCGGARTLRGAASRTRWRASERAGTAGRPARAAIRAASAAYREALAWRNGRHGRASRAVDPLEPGGAGTRAGRLLEPRRSCVRAEAGVAIGAT